MSDNLENVRRMAERGLMRAQQPPMKSAFIDMFQHILDEYGRAKADFEKLEQENTKLNEQPKLKDNAIDELIAGFKDAIKHTGKQCYSSVEQRDNWHLLANKHSK